MHDFSKSDLRALRIAIIGGGTAGMSAAVSAAAAGARVTLIERNPPGGTTAVTGASPARVMARAGDPDRSKSQSPPGGRKSHTTPVSDAHQRAFQRWHANPSHRGGSAGAGFSEFEFVPGDARFLDERTIAVAMAPGERMIKFDFALIATGATAYIPPIPGLHEATFWTPNDAINAKETPRHLIVVGGSIPAVELAQTFSRRGCRVTMLVRSRLLPADDPLVGATLAAAFAAEGIAVLTGTKPDRVERQGERVFVTTSEGELVGCHVLIACGREPNTAGLNLEAVGVRVDANGAVIVNPRMETTTPRIYAAGDCTNPSLNKAAHAAAAQCAVDNMLGQRRAFDQFATPVVVGTDPQVASVGYREADSQRAGIATETCMLTLDNSTSSPQHGGLRGFIKLVAERDTRRLLGAQILGKQAGQLAKIAAEAIRAGDTLFVLADPLAPYISAGEDVKLRAASQDPEYPRLSH